MSEPGSKSSTPGADAPLAEAVGELVGRLWRRSRDQMGRAAKRGRDLLSLRQMRADRDRMYIKLGKEARHLVEGGEVDHPGLRKGVERIIELEARILAAEDALRDAGMDPDDPGAEPTAPSEGASGPGNAER